MRPRVDGMSRHSNSMSSETTNTSTAERKPGSLQRFAEYVRRRKKRFLALAVLMIAVIVPYTVSRVRSPQRRVRIVSASDTAKPPSQAPQQLRIVTYNIAHGRGPVNGNWEGTAEGKEQRVLTIARRLKSLQADVIVLNEVDFHSTWSGHRNQAELIADAAGFPYRVEQRNYDFRFLYGSWKFGNAVLSRYPVVKAELVDYSPVAEWESWLAGKKRGVVCTLRLSEERLVRILAVHIDTRSAEVRVRSVKAMLEVAGESDVPLIAAGDFNSTPPGFPLSESDPRGHNAMRVLLDSGRFQTRLRPPSGEDDMTFSVPHPQSVIDWILIPAGWRFDEYRVLDWDHSDHRPVLATVRLPE